MADRLRLRIAMTKVLVVDDEENLVTSHEYNLVRDGYDVYTASNGPEALDVARRERPDLIILDVMLPGLSGLEVCQVLRKETTAPVIMLSAKGQEIDRVVGLEIGADDYVTKPFSMRELLARIRAQVRRIPPPLKTQHDDAGTATLQSGTLRVNLASHEVSAGDSLLSLTPKEFDLLAFLMRNPTRAFTRLQLLDEVWGTDFYGDIRTVDVHIRWLREKIEEDPSRPTRVETVRGVGYRFKP